MAQPGPHIQLNAMLGLKGTLFGAISYLDETDVQYVAGRNLVRFDSETRTQHIIHGSPTSAGITAIAVSPNRKHVAYAEFSYDRIPVVAVFDWANKRRKKVLGGMDGVTAPITSLHFTSDGKHLLVQTGAPEWTLYYIQWEKGPNGRVVAMTRNVSSAAKPVAQVDTHPNDPTTIVAAGRGVYKVYRLQDDGTTKLLPINLKRDPGAFTCHAWLPDERLVLGCANGELWIVEGHEFKRLLDAGPSGPKAVAAVAAFSKGFLVGCDGGLLRVYEKSEDARLYYKLTKEFSVGEDGMSSRVTGIGISSSEEDAAIVTSTGQAYTFKLASYELQKPGESPFRPLVASFHTVPALGGARSSGASGPEDALAASLVSTPGFGAGKSADPLGGPNMGITGVDICVRKPIFVTCGADRTVRVWNYLGISHADAGSGGGGGAGGGAGDGNMHAHGALPEITPALELVERFSEVPSCIAIHPTGFLCAVGFESSLQLLSIQLDAIRLVKEFPIRNASEVRFNHSGSMFAVINSAAINVYGTYTCHAVATLRGHADRAMALAWSRDDRYIVSAGKDGMIIRYAIVVPNATSTPSAGGSSSGSAPSTAGGAGGSGGSSGLGATGAAATGPLAAVGKVVHQVDIRDFTPLGLVMGNSDSGKDVFVSGIISKPGTNSTTSVFRHIDLTAGSKEPPRVDVPMHNSVVRALASFTSTKVVLAGMSSSLSVPTAGGAGAGGVGPGTLHHSSSSHMLTHAGSSNRLLSVSSPSDGTGAGAGLASPTKSAGGSAVAHTPHTPAATSAAAAAALVGGLSPPPVEPTLSDSIGCVRVYRNPLSEEHTDVVCHGAAVARIAISHDERLVITAATDGTLGIWALHDAKGRTAGASSAADEHLPFAEEVLVTKADMEKVRTERNELESRVQEITMTNKYNERYKDMTNEEKLREMEEQFGEELSGDREKLLALRAEKAEMEASNEAQIEMMRTTQARELETLEHTYKTKIKNEIARYDKLVIERDTMNKDFEVNLRALLQEQAAALDALKARYESMISEEQGTVAGLEEQRAKLTQDSASRADEVEYDADGEIEDMRSRYEAKLAAESNATLLLKGENGFMKTKFKALTKEIADQRDEISALGDKERELHEAITALQKDVAGHKKEIKEREETIQEKESRVYELKKKNQELEKFKFVLNYKIQELKRQIMPRNREISDMREQLKDMELELLQYHKSNAALDLMIGELKLKRDGLAREVGGLEGHNAERAEELLKIARDVDAVRATASDAKVARSTLTRLYHKYINNDAGSLASAIAAIEPADGGEPGDGSSVKLPVGVNVDDVQKELTRQRQHLQRNVESIAHTMDKEAHSFATDQARLMRENAFLTQEINDLRRDLNFATRELERAKLGIDDEALAARARALNDTGAGEGRAASAAGGEDGVAMLSSLDSMTDSLDAAAAFAATAATAAAAAPGSRGGAAAAVSTAAAQQRASTSGSTRSTVKGGAGAGGARAGTAGGAGGAGLGATMGTNTGTSTSSRRTAAVFGLVGASGAAAVAGPAATLVLSGKGALAKAGAAALRTKVLELQQSANQ